jgi:hypothetical protein
MRKQLTDRRHREVGLSVFTHDCARQPAVRERIPELVAEQSVLKFVEDGGSLGRLLSKTNEWNPNEQAQPAAARAVSDHSREMNE